jgi:hypothetical protein
MTEGGIPLKTIQVRPTLAPCTTATFEYREVGALKDLSKRQELSKGQDVKSRLHSCRGR